MSIKQDNLTHLNYLYTFKSRKKTNDHKSRIVMKEKQTFIDGGIRKGT